jgi:DNA replication protein DnaC
MKNNNNPVSPLLENLKTLRLPYSRTHCEDQARLAGKNAQTHLEYLAELMAGEVDSRQQRTIARRTQLAHFPTLKTLESFNWDWPKSINRLQIQDLFRLSFIQNKTNVIFLGNVGLGKSHLSVALGHHACLKGHTVYFANTIEVINNLQAATVAGTLKTELRKYTKPDLLILDEMGYLPIDQRGADLLFQVVSSRYERGSIILTTNKPFKDWPTLFNSDSTFTSALLDRLLHNAQTILIEGSSYRMKDRIEPLKDS